MEITGIILGICLVLWIFGLTPKKSDNPVKRIDEKNWIVDGQFISFETDTPLQRMQQELEDLKHYSSYKRYKERIEWERKQEEKLIANIPEDQKWLHRSWEIFSPPNVGCYMIYNHKTAKYVDGDMWKLMEEQYQNEKKCQLT